MGKLVGEGDERMFGEGVVFCSLIGGEDWVKG